MPTTIDTRAARRELVCAALRLARLDYVLDRNNGLYKVAKADLDTAARALVAQLPS